MTEVIANVVALAMYGGVAALLLTSRERQRRVASIVAILLVGAFPLFLGWSARSVSATYQAAGGLFALLGIGVVSEWVANRRELAVSVLHRARIKVRRQLVIARRRLSNLWLRLRRRPVPVFIHALAGTATASGGGAVGTIGKRGRVNPEEVTNRQWLTILDQRIEDLHESLHSVHVRVAAQNEEHQEIVRQQAHELRAEIFRATRNGWQLVVVGLIYSILGAVIGSWS